jgi:hypothetical protein
VSEPNGTRDGYYWKLTVKGGPGSGHWGHAGRPGKVGGSLPADVAVSVATGRTARERQAAARGDVPGKFQSIEQARDWFVSQGMEADLIGVTNLEAVNVIAAEIDRIRGEFGWAFDAQPQIERIGGSYRMGFSETKTNKFLGIGTYESENCPGKVVDLGGDAAAMTEDRSTLVRDQGGPVIWWNPDTVNANRPSFLAEIGYTSRPTRTLDGVTTHEMGHVIMSMVSKHPNPDKYELTPEEPRFMRFSETFQQAVRRVGITKRMVKMNVSNYALENEREMFAEFFTVMQHRDQTDMSKAFERRLTKLAAILKEETGLEVLKWSSP